MKMRFFFLISSCKYLQIYANFFLIGFATPTFHVLNDDGSESPGLVVYDPIMLELQLKLDELRFKSLTEHLRMQWFGAKSFNKNLSLLF